jgi:uncharacterized protein (DUF1800 family)
MANISSAAWNYKTAAHLLLRAGFGHNGRYRKSTGEALQVRALANKTPEKAVDSLLAFRVSKARGPGKLDTSSSEWDKLQTWWFDRMVKATSPVREKIVLFLHWHFATARSRVNKPIYMAQQNALLREFALGDFRELVKRINIDPAMLWWLDGQTNRKSAPNENYGRELMELFTLGVFDFAGKRNYSQTDVTEVAKVLTGWRNREDSATKVTSYFLRTDQPTAWKSRHNTDAKTIFAPDPIETPDQSPLNLYIEPANTTDGALAEAEHRRLVDAIFNHVDTEGRPTVARHIARRAWKFFAYDPVVDVGTPRTDLALIDDLANEFKNSGYSLKALLRAIFLREEFYADSTRTVKSPVELVVGTLRMLRGRCKGDTRIALATDRTADMGQELLNPPDVFSWPGNQAWVTTQTLLSRFTFARDLAQRDKSAKNEIGFEPRNFLDLSENTRAQVVDRFLYLLGPVSVDALTRDELIAWLGNSDPIDLLNEDFLNKQVRGLVNLILTLPQYHTH